MQVPSYTRARAAPARLTAALLGAATLAIPGAAAAATVVQSASFSEFHSVTIQFGFLNPAPARSADDVVTQALGFDAFDTSLGVLTGARWRLSSDQDYGTGLSLYGPGDATLSNTRAISFVQVGGEPLGAENTVAPSAAVKCSTTPEDQGCLTVVHALDAFEFDVEADDLSPFLQPGGVEALLGSRVILAVQRDGFFAIAAATGVLDWSGALSLTYTYEPTGGPSAAPEPVTWSLMIVGFGLSGAGLRRRRAMTLDATT